MATKQKHIIILGAGFAGVYAYFQLHKLLRSEKNISITLVSDRDYFLFVTLLHEVATGSLLPLSITQSLRSPEFKCVDRFVEGNVVALDLDKKQVLIRRKGYSGHAHAGEAHGERDEVIAYDYVVNAIGSTAHFFNTKGADQYAYALKTQHDAKDIKNRLIDNFALASELSDRHAQIDLLHTVVIGGGPTGVEMAGELADYIHKELYDVYPTLRNKAQITLLHGSAKLLEHANSWFHTEAYAILKKKGVDVRLNTRANEITSKSVITEQKVIPAGLIIWTAGVMARNLEIRAEKTVERDQSTNRIKVNEYLQIENYKEAFVVGDQAWIFDKDTKVAYPMRAQFAEREGKTAADNINALIFKRQLHAFQWKDKGFIVSLGYGGALAEVYGMRFKGWFAWWLYRTVYATKIVGWRARLRTVGEWTMNLFFPRDISKL